MTATSWQTLMDSAPRLAAFGEDRLDGRVAYLATTRKDGMPRNHPVTPIIGGGYCFIFVDPDSPKVRDLRENGNFCLHCGMSDSSGSSGEFLLTGTAAEIEDSELREIAEANSSYRPSGRYLLFELRPLEAVATSYRGGRPDRSRWTA